MGRILSDMIDYLTDEDWKFDIIEGQTLLKFVVQAHSGRLICYADIEEEKELLMIYSYLPVNAPLEKRPLVAEFITRANHGMRIGNFEMDYNDGEVRYKTSIDVEGGELTPKMIENLLSANLSTMDRYFNGLMAVIFGNREPREVIEQIEHPPSDDADASD